MKPENITFIPKDKCPLDVLAQMGERIKDDWIFLHRNVIDNLEHSSGVSLKVNHDNTLTLSWKATEDYPETKIVIDLCSSAYTKYLVWKPVILILAADIKYDLIPTDTDEIIFLQMEE